MIRSLAIILVPILIITVIATRNLEDHPVTVVDYQPVLARARAEAPFPVLAPENLPQSWRATRVSWTKAGQPGLNRVPSPRNEWKLGLLAPNDVYIALTQGDLRPAELVEDETRDGRRDGTSNVGSTAWERRVSPDDRTRSLVRSDGGATTVVAGDTGYEALESYAATLRSG